MTNDLIWLGMFAVVSGLAGFAVWGIEAVARRKERSRAAITDREHRNSLARAIGARDRRLLSDRVAADVAERHRATAAKCDHYVTSGVAGVTSVTTATFSAGAGLSAGSAPETTISRDTGLVWVTPDLFHFPAAAHAPEKLDRDSEYARGTVLSLVPKA